MSTYIDRVTLAIAGIQQTSVTSHTMTSDELPHITVHTGQLQLVCTSASAVRAWAEGWAIGRDLRIQSSGLPLDTRISEPRYAALGTLAIMASCSGYRDPRVVGMPSAGRDDHAYVEVAVDAVTVRAYDQRAVTSMLEAWTHALWLSKPAFANPLDLRAPNGRQIAQRQHDAQHR